MRSAQKEIGVLYLGNVAHSTKLLHTLTEKNISTYGIYLAPADLSGYNVCPNSAACREHCLFGSGHTLIDLRSGRNKIVNSRIKKTKLFVENRDYFMQWMIHEIKVHKLQAELDGSDFSVRLNCTSDISIRDFVYKGRCICDIFPDIQFYDYTKVYNNLDNVNEFSNYDLTYSYNGYNWNLCEKALNKNIRVAVVFEKHIPNSFHGFKVINGDTYDSRYMDDKNVIVGLKFKMTASTIKNGHFEMPKTPFVVSKDNEFCEW